MDIHCEHCGSLMRTRSSKQPHPDYRKLYLECLNPDCGARVRADFIVTETLSPRDILNKSTSRMNRDGAPSQGARSADSKRSGENVRRTAPTGRVAKGNESCET
ncbi:ogr/Delta-like zinc finger family protein [Salinicola peritrichatus]|uniref:ogr/Delta-like zinc finger family protein n=1 Tax=Salinicola peritrichatus TaxID=1267424 RepID=UPI003B82E155